VWDAPAVTTFRLRNHTVRDAGWRYIRYANADEELYDEGAAPYKRTNLAGDPGHAGTNRELAKHLPSNDCADITSRAPGRMQTLSRAGPHRAGQLPRSLIRSLGTHRRLPAGKAIDPL
jgi:hypothetical protein